MKRVLLIGIILAICILAMPQGVLAATSGGGAAQQADVTAKIASYIDLTVSGPGTTTWNMAFIPLTDECALGGGTPFGHCNQLTEAINFALSSNDGWTVNSKANPTFGGWMWKDGTTIPHLVNMLQIGPDGSSAYVTTDVDRSLKTGAKTASTSFKQTLRQVVDINDDATNTYKITLTFNAVTNT
jgi:hypothetical protein